MSYFSTIYNYGFSSHDSDWNFQVAGSVFWRMYFVVDGDACVRIYGDIHSLTPGHLYLIPAYEPHENICEGKFDHHYVHFTVEDPSLSALLERYQLAFGIPASALSESLYARIADLCRGFELPTPVPQIYEKGSNYVCWGKRYEALASDVKMELEGCLRILLSHFIRHSTERSAKIHPVVAKGKNYIDANCRRPILIDNVADYLDIRAETFSRLFRRDMGESPHDYLMRKRINSAKSLLKLSSMSVKQIAAECGFCDSSYFCLSFRRLTGMTPGRFRRSD